MKIKLLIAAMVAVLLSTFMVTSPANAQGSYLLRAKIDSNARSNFILYTGCDCIPDSLTGPRDHQLFDGQTADATYVYVYPNSDLWCYEPYYMGDILMGYDWTDDFAATGWHATGNWSIRTGKPPMGCEYRND